jgi:hypothetical protein
MIQVRDKEANISMHLYQGEYTIDFVNIDKPDDFCSTTVQAHAADTSDKSPGKSLSYATKAILLKTFSLETGESDESRASEYALYTDIQKDEFQAFITSNDDPLGFLCFTKTIGDESYIALQKTFEPGQIVSGKKVAGALISKGGDILDEAVHQIATAIDNQDTGAVLEVLAEFELPVEKVLLGARMNAQQIGAIKKIKELAA